jgi:outer membrane protein assembly factor BamB
MSTRPPRTRERKPLEPEYAWGGGTPPALLWEHTARQLWAQVTPGAGTVVLAEPGRLILRSASTGQALWDRPWPEMPDELSLDAAGVVLGAAQDVAELDAASGTERWRRRLGGAVTMLATDEQRVYAAIAQGRRGHLFVLDRADGSVRWRTPSHAEPELYPYPQHETLVVTHPEEETVQAYQSATGERRWEFSADGQPPVVGALAGDRVLVSGHSHGVSALDVHTGETCWKMEGEGAFEAPAVVLGDRAFATDGAVYAVDAQTGKRAWRFKLENEDERVFALRVEHGSLLAETWHGRLLSLSPEDGKIRWERSPGQVHGTASDPGRLYLRVNLSDVDEAEAESAAPVRWAVLALDPATGDLVWELRARRLVPDISVAGNALIVELRTQVIALGT